MEGFGISSDLSLNPLKVEKVNIGSLENPKFTNIEDYWDDETIGKIVDLLYEFQVTFPIKIFRDEGDCQRPLRDEYTIRS